ncbi:hypothetical protein BU26DRAFT_563342 [Trematosphaeria pertusa]|uniref:Cupin type-2 domain-containing protein n=1 Tax=Trematosphaeria pertusa TaxID=390896 RepID=A0A6A6IPH4_9PLEO|nr:uncharacterized protein BU26DRAFT_563342 [Trematosphaeria pertusa]KAF2251403.1 hypothetical protein BU26DRAFT_563342 [Trematosphaeria pertusa]
MADFRPKLSIPQALSKIPAPYQPTLVASLNDAIEFKIAKIKGDFVYHSHPTTDELFYILDGGPLTMRIRRIYDDPSSEETVVLEKGDVFVVPKGVQHLLGADNECSVLCAETKGELNTGDLGVMEKTSEVKDARN